MIGRALCLIAGMSTLLAPVAYGQARGWAGAVAEIPLPEGMRNEHDDEASRDPRGLPRLLDYEMRSIGRHTLSDTVPDADGRPTDVPLGRVETREYRIGRYAKRPPSPPREILRHYRRQLEVIGGTTLAQSDHRLTGRFLRGNLPVLVTVEARGDGKYYEVTTGGPGAQDGVTGLVVSPPPEQAMSVDHHRRDSQGDRYGDRQGDIRSESGSDSRAGAADDRRPPAGSAPDAPVALVDARPSASSSFSLPSAAALWPPRGTRGMAVLLVGPGVHRAVAIRFGTSDAEILARETGRVRVRVPLLPDGVVPVTVVESHGAETVRGGFQILDAPPGDAAAIAVPPCDSRPGNIADLNLIAPQPVRPGQLLKLAGRRFEQATHVTFTVARHEVDPQARGIDPDLVGIDFGAAGKGRSAPRWLDTLAANIGRSYGAQPSVPGQCDAGNTAGYAAIRHTADREGVVCVPPLAISGPIGLWRASGKTGDLCDTSEVSVRIARSPSPTR